MKTAPQPRLWTPAFILSQVITVFAFCSGSIVNSTLSLYIVEQHAGSPNDVSVITSMMVLTTFLFRPLSGFLVDHWGRKWIITTSFFLYAIINLSMLAPLNLAGLGVLRFLYGIPFAVGTTALHTLTSDIIPPERRAEGFSYGNIVITLTMMVIALNLGLYLSAQRNYPLIFILSALFAILAIILTLIIRYRDIKNPKLTFSFNLNMILEGRVAWLTLILGFIFLGWPGINTFGPLYAREVGFQNAGIYLTVFAMGTLISRLIITRVFNPKNPRWAGLLSLTFILAGFAFIGFIRSKVGLLCGGALMGTGFGLAFATFAPMALNLVEAGRRGTCNSTLIFGQDVGAFIGTYMFGYVAQTYGTYSAPYGLTALLILIPVILFVVVALPDYRKRNKELAQV